MVNMVNILRYSDVGLSERDYDGNCYDLDFGILDGISNRIYKDNEYLSTQTNKHRSAHYTHTHTPTCVCTRYVQQHSKHNKKSIIEREWIGWT